MGREQKKKVLSKEEKYQENLLYNLNLANESIPLSLLWENHRFIIYLSAFWYACVIVDMYAIDVKLSEAITPALVLVCFPLVLESVGWVFRHCFLPSKNAVKNSNDNDRSTAQVA